jgi:hypothetical protein
MIRSPGLYSVRSVGITTKRSLGRTLQMSLTESMGAEKLRTMMMKMKIAMTTTLTEMLLYLRVALQLATKFT